MSESNTIDDILDALGLHYSMATRAQQQVRGKKTLNVNEAKAALQAYIESEVIKALIEELEYLDNAIINDPAVMVRLEQLKKTRTEEE